MKVKITLRHNVRQIELAFERTFWSWLKCMTVISLELMELHVRVDVIIYHS